MGRASIPVFVLLMGLSAAAMMVPALVAGIEQDWVSARAYLQGGLLLAVITLLIGLALRTQDPASGPRAQLLTLLGAYAVLPVLLAIPHHQALGQGTLGQAVLDMISAITTTGAPIYDHWQSIPRAVHLWRAEVAWLGGFLTWVCAAAILAPMNLGGFEVRAPVSAQGSVRAYEQISRAASSLERMGRFARELAPVYGGLTLVLWISLLIAGDDELIALCHAMSVMATSGISPIGGLDHTQSGIMGEAMMLLFLFFALSRTTFTRTYLGDRQGTVRRDPELRLGLLLIAATTVLLFLQHWLSAGNLGAGQDGARGLATLWGTFFTSASFLTTTGFESVAWGQAGWWSGVDPSGLILIGLAVIGGGVATTAGGVKLMRIFALWLHLRREVDLLILPRSVSGGGGQMRRIRKQGALAAWVLFMLFAISITAVMLAMSLNGVQFETAMVMAVAALSNCGPLVFSAAEIPVSFSEVPPLSQMVLGLAMIAGRMESLAIIALMNASFWRG